MSTKKSGELTASSLRPRDLTSAVAAAERPVEASLILSNERTFLAWLRTGVAVMAFGFVVAKFGIYLKLAAHTQFGPDRLGLIMVGGGIMFIASGALHYHRVKKCLEYGTPLSHSRMPTALGLLMLVAGAIVFFYLFQAE